MKTLEKQSEMTKPVETLEKLSEAMDFIEKCDRPNDEINIVGVRNELQKRFPKRENEDGLYESIRTYHEQLTAQIESRDFGIANKYGALLTLERMQKEYS